MVAIGLAPPEANVNQRLVCLLLRNNMEKKICKKMEEEFLNLIFLEENTNA
jgi:hypothetical protein